MNGQLLQDLNAALVSAQDRHATVTNNRARAQLATEISTLRNAIDRLTSASGVACASRNNPSNVEQCK